MRDLILTSILLNDFKSNYLPFKVELLYKIMPRIWGIVFLQSTMMKGVTESGARQGLKERVLTSFLTCLEFQGAR